MGRESGFPDMRGQGILCRALRRSGFFLPVSPALTGWAKLCRAYGASDCRCYLYPALTGWANLCRAYGASDCRFYPHPALAGWANLCRAYGAFWKREFESARASEAAWQTDFGLDKAVTILVGFVL